MLAKLNEYAKTVVAIIGAVVVLLVTVGPLFPDQDWVPTVVAALTAAAVFIKRNVPAE